MLQEFYINDIEEITENDDLYGIMNKRIFYCKNVSSTDEPYGPPDICYLVKETQSKGFLGLGSKKVTKFGSYHYVYGLDTSNIAYISAYISKFIQKLNTNTFKITQSIFCIFDYFLEKDLRILIKFPGGVRKVFYIDDQQAIEANTDDLRTVYLSSLIRCWTLNDIKSNSLHIEEVNNLESFNYMVDCIHYLVKDTTEYKYINFHKKLGKLFDYLIKFLMNTRRFNIAIFNFSKLSNIDNTLVKYVIKPLKFLNLYEDALSYIASVLMFNSSSNLLYLEVDLLTLLKKYEDAMEIGKFISSLSPESPENWLCLSNVYLKKKQYENCLRALNNIYFLKEYSLNDIVNMKNAEGAGFKDIPFPKNKAHTINIKFSDILFENKEVIDIVYGSSQFYMCENADILYDTINKIMNCPYYKFDKNQKQCYSMILEIIKEINFDAFIDLKRKLFFFNLPNSQGNGETERSSTFRSEGIQTVSYDHKISINPFLELVIDNLIEDLKIFSIVIAQDELYFNSLFNKDDLSITEVKFCIAIGILSERLKYYNTSLKFYNKALRFCFSKFTYIRKIKIFAKLKDYKSVMILLSQFLSFIPSEQFKFINKTPHWIDKILLRILYEFQINEIISWISDAGKHIIDFILKKIIQKYKNWIDAGQELHLIK